MTLRHIALLRFRPGTSDEHVEALMTGLGSLPAAIPELRDYRFGRDLGLSTDNWQFGIVADVDDARAYERYRLHPAHRALIDELISPVLEARASVQYEVE